MQYNKNVYKNIVNRNIVVEVKMEVVYDFSHILLNFCMQDILHYKVYLLSLELNKWQSFIFSINISILCAACVFCKKLVFGSLIYFIFLNVCYSARSCTKRHTKWNERSGRRLCMLILRYLCHYELFVIKYL